MIELYGINNCDTVKKARTWLNEHGIDHQFHDFKKQAPSPETIEQWLQHIPLNTLLNKRGTTWRTLTPEQQADCTDQQQAILLMSAKPSLIKRPILIADGKAHCGFSSEQYQNIINSPSE